MPTNNSYYRPLLFLIFLTTAFRLIYINFIELAPDEAYYWDLSRRLQLSYYDHPPMVMYLIDLSTKVFGNTEFAVRLPSVIISGIVTVLVYLLGKELFDERIGFYSALLINITLIYSIGGILATIDTPFAMFWLLALYSGAMALKTGDGKWWYLKDVALGLGMLSKYVMVLFVPAFLMFILLSKEHRHWLRRKEPYIGSIIAILIFSPVIIWNAQNDWLSFKFQLAHGLKVKKKAGLSFLMKYIGSQAAVLSPLLFIACIWAIIKGFIIWVRDRDWRYLFLTCTSSFVLLFFGYSSIRAKVEGNWPMPAYFAAIIAFVSLYFKSGYPRKRIVAAAIAGTALLFSTIAHIQPVTPVLSIKNDLTDQLYGWEQVAKEAGDTLETFRRDGAIKPFILAGSHTLAAELAFYTPSHPMVYELSGRGRLNQYNLWPPPETASDAVMIAESGIEKDRYVISLFDEIKLVRKVELKRGEKIIGTYSLYACRNFHGFKLVDM